MADAIDGEIPTAEETSAIEAGNINTGADSTAGEDPANGAIQTPATDGHSSLDPQRYLHEIIKSTCFWQLSMKTYIIVDNLLCHEHFNEQSENILQLNSMENVHGNILGSGVTRQVYYCVACTPVHKYKHVTLTRWCSKKSIYCNTCHSSITIPNSIIQANTKNREKWQSAFTYLNNTGALNITLEVFLTAQRSTSRNRVVQQVVDSERSVTAHYYR